MIPIVIATTPGRENWLTQCLGSLGDKTAIVLSDYSFELGKIKWVYDNTCLDRWLLLQDSVVVKDHRFFDLLEEYPHSVAVSNCPTVFGMYLGVYSRDTLSAVGIPKVNSKEEAIHYEVAWSNKYCSVENVPVLFTDFADGNSKGFRYVFGRNNMVIENEYLIKYKGNWYGAVSEETKKRCKV
jgi:hypothetical protein